MARLQHGERAQFGDIQPLEPLTLKEIEFVNHLWDGLTSKEIANRMNVSVSTAETHRANIGRKLFPNGGMTQAWLVRKCIELGYIKVDGRLLKCPRCEMIKLFCARTFMERLD